LLPLVATAQKQYADPSNKPVIDSIAGAPIDPEFINAFPQRFAIAKVAGSQAVDSSGDFRLSP
jgi:hypothetical protein